MIDLKEFFLHVSLFLIGIFISVFLIGISNGTIRSFPQQHFENDTSECIFDVYNVISRDYFNGVYYFLVYDKYSFVMYTCSYSSGTWSRFEVLYNSDGSFRLYDEVSN